MKKRIFNSFTKLFISLLFVMSPFILLPFQAHAIESPNCGDTAFPAFIGGSGFTPNLLILIDNSASMYDIGYNEGFIGSDSVTVKACADGTQCTTSADCVAPCQLTKECENGDDCTATNDCTASCQVTSVGQCENGDSCTVDSDCVTACQASKECENGDDCSITGDCTDSCKVIKSCENNTACTDDDDCETNCNVVKQCQDGTTCTVDSDCEIPCKVIGECHNDKATSCTVDSDCTKNNDYCVISSDPCPAYKTCKTISDDCPTYKTCKTISEPCPTYTTCKTLSEPCPNYKTCLTVENNPCPTYTTCETTIDPCGGNTDCIGTTISLNNIPCIDNNYDNNATYMGYFASETWYSYNLTDKQFEISDNTGGDFVNDYIRLFLVSGSTNKIQTFKAKGNYLNWATSSKFDIEKTILTGGKYNSGILESEGRGCSGNIFIKQVEVESKYFTLGIRADKTNATGNPDATLIDILNISDNPYNPDSCQSLIAELDKGKDSKLPAVRTYLGGCLNDPGETHKLLHYPAHDCWWSVKQGKDPIQGYKYDDECSSYYSTKNKQPKDLLPFHICYGDSTDNKEDGFIGECWNEGATPSTGDWKTDDQLALMGYTDKKPLEDCINAARSRYCDFMFESQSGSDPSDLNTTNINSFATIMGVYGQTGTYDPPETYQAKVKISNDASPVPPEGLVQKYAEKINVGVMAFNVYGSATECTLTGMAAYGCGTSTNQDGSYLVQGIGPSHTPALVTNINNIKATDTWTPLAEMMFNAIGYYAQRDDFRINDTDFVIPETTPPISSQCSKNFVLLITDGSSTADQNDKMETKVQALNTNSNDDNDSDPSSCGTLYGSTYLDDLTYYAMYGTDLFTGGIPYKNISTFIVVNGVPDDSGETGECDPLTLLNNASINGGTDSAIVAETPEDLFDEIDNIFAEISSKSASGSAASVVSATRSGEGAVYQAVFWPSLDIDEEDTIAPISWVGDVHGVFVDNQGLLYEDTNRDGQLTIGTDEEAVLDGASLHDTKYLWSAAEWLATIGDADINTQRSYDSSEKKRYIFTWNDDNDGIVESNEIIAFDENNAEQLDSLLYPELTDDPDNDDDASLLINWLRGEDQNLDTFRKRKELKPTNFNFGAVGDLITWRLGDVIHCTPIAVGRPFENYHMQYQDTTYLDFLIHYENRRQVVYFGANDGMIHAVNAGFFDAGLNKFSITDPTGSDSVEYELGAELWAYVPYNLLPHLFCLKSPDYSFKHKYYNDGTIRLFDVKIFPADTDHPGGWGTILVAGMRFGGTPVNGADGRKFISSYVIMDITNPAKAPTLLGELTSSGSDASMGYTTGSPAVVPMKSGDTYKWYLVFGSGPTIAVDSDAITNPVTAISDQTARIAIFPLDQLTTGSGDKKFRIPASEPFSGSAGRYVLTPSPKGFVSDIVTVDFELETDYRADVLYFGTIEDSSVTSGTTVEGEPGGDWSGKLYRWATLSDDEITAPGATTAGWSKPAIMFNPGRPISAAPSIGYDGENYWIYFGTGRFLDLNDKTSEQDFYFGLKEPMDCDGNFLWKSDNSGVYFEWDKSKIQATHLLGGYDSYPAETVLPGNRKLFRVDQIEVKQGESAESSDLTCVDGGVSCLPYLPDNCFFETSDQMSKFSELIDYIAGGCCVYTDGDPDGYVGTDGWYRKLPLGERNLAQATLLGGLVTFTTFNPISDDICKTTGESFLNALYYQTGTSWYESIFNTDVGLSESESPEVINRLELGEGLAPTPNLHKGTDDEEDKEITVVIGISTPDVIKIKQPVLPISIKSGRTSWRSK